MLNSRLGIIHPQFVYHPRPSVNSAMTVRVRISSPPAKHAEWVPNEGMSGGDGYTVVWEGMARVAPNKDWRARTRDFSAEFDATQAVRVQVPIGKNLLGAERDAEGKIVKYGEDPEFFLGYVVEVLEAKYVGGNRLEGNRYTVRNALSGSLSWLNNLLCDAGTKDN